MDKAKITEIQKIEEEEKRFFETMNIEQIRIIDEKEANNDGD